MKAATLAIASTLSATEAASGKCRVLALSSGDEDAAYQAGAMKGIVTATQLSPDDYQYDGVTGVSGGALNAVLLSSFDKGSES